MRREFYSSAALATVRAMKVIKSYGSRVDADLARIALNAEGIEATVIGVGVGMEGGADSVRLMVPDDEVDAALKILGDS
jgi:hypothetical protein